MSWANGYNYRALITFNVHPTSNLTAFPNLVLGTYSQLADIAHGGYVNNTVTLLGQTVPADLIFTSDSAGTVLLSWEIESWNNVTGAIVAWVNSDRLAASDTLIYVWVGKSSVTAYQCTASTTWDAAYKGVWHLPNGVSSLSAKDSTSYSHDGVLINTPTAVSGKIDGAVQFVGSSSQWIDIPFALSNFMTATVGTMEGWVYTASSNPTDNGAGQGAQILSDGETGAGGYVWLSLDGADAMAFGGFSGGNQSISYIALHGSWHHAVWVHTSGNLYGFLDGIQVVSIPLGSIPILSSNLSMSRSWDGYFMTGNLDEVRASNVARGADWIAHEYRQQAQASAWYTVGAFLASALMDWDSLANLPSKIKNEVIAY